MTSDSDSDFVSLRTEVLRRQLTPATTAHFMSTIDAAERRRDPIARRRAVLDILAALNPYRGDAAR